MANLSETPDYPAGVYQLETSDPVLGGPGGIANRQAEQLANRTSWLKAKVDAFIDGTVAVFKATKLATARTLSISGAGSGSASFDGSANATIALTLADSGAVAGTYPKVTINAKGLVTGGAALVAADIPSLDWSKITSGKPTTLGGYGITDAQPLDATLTALAAQVTAANQMIYSTGVDSFAMAALTAFARTLLDDADAATARATLGAQPLDATLTALAAQVTAADQLIYSTGVDAFGMTALTAFARTLLGGADAAAARATLAAAPLASPALTGTPTVPTAADGTNTTQAASTAFVQAAVGGYLSKATTGGTVTLTDAEASNPVIAVSGALTSNSVIVLPTTTKRLWAIYNATSGAFTLTVKTAAGTGVTVAQGKRNLVYTDGTNIYDAFNDFESIALTGVPTAPTAAVGNSST